VDESNGVEFVSWKGVWDLSLRVEVLEISSKCSKSFFAKGGPALGRSLSPVCRGRRSIRQNSQGCEISPEKLGGA